MQEKLFPQAHEMADISMVRTLAAQALAIWPQEQEILKGYGLSGALRVLDGGCGTGEITERLAETYPEAEVVGVDLLDSHLDLARERHLRFGSRVRFENRSLYDLGWPAGGFDLVVCRHVLQSIPHPERVLRELVRVTRHSGRLHLLMEDYGMIHFQRGRSDPDLFWRALPSRFEEEDGLDMHIGRNALSLLLRLGLDDVQVDYVTVDTLRVPRETFAAIWEAWRDGYTETAARYLKVTTDEVRAEFDDQIATLRAPGGYAVWHIPIVSARVP